MTTATEPDIVEGIAREVREDDQPRGLQVVPEIRGHLMSGLGAVALLTDEQFDANVAMLAKAKARAQQLQKALLTEGTDYGTVKGIARPFLHKPGAEIFEKAYGLATSYEVERKVGDGVKTPELEYIVHAKVHLGDTDGPVVGEGLGSCNTHESKYRYRSAKRTCPDCGVEGLIKGKADGRLRGKWWCPPNSGGCGHTFEPDSPKGQEISAQVVGQVENENPYDLANTILKMARKRAGVDGILTTTGTSGLFTQDDDSPAVQGEAGGSSDASEQRQESSTTQGGSRSSSLPTIPKNLQAEASLGQVSVSGSVYLGDKPPGDGALRQGPDGAALVFKLDLGNAKLNQCVVRGPLAEALSVLGGGNGDDLIGLTATVEGEMFAVPWKKKDDDGVEKDMPPFRRLEVTKITTGEWVLPATVDQVDAGPKAPEGKPAGQRRTRSQSKPDAAAAGELPPDAPAGPGMDAPSFQKVLDTENIAGVYALQMAKEKWPEAETLHGLTDQQRLELAGEMGLLTEEA